MSELYYGASHTQYYIPAIKGESYLKIPFVKIKLIKSINNNEIKGKGFLAEIQLIGEEYIKVIIPYG